MVEKVVIEILLLILNKNLLKLNIYSQSKTKSVTKSSVLTFETAPMEDCLVKATGLKLLNMKKI